MKSTYTYIAAVLVTLLFSGSSIAGGDIRVHSHYHTCLLAKVETLPPNTTLHQLKQTCLLEQQVEVKTTEKAATNFELGVISQRIAQEWASEFNSYVITPHEMNYLLPLTVTDEINRQAYLSENSDSDTNSAIGSGMKNTEAKFQLSLKVPMNSEPLFRDHNKLYIGFTLKSLWQVYAKYISAPFRETNYKPEVFYLTPLDWHPYDGNTGLAMGFEHQSNGRTQLLSRSWNRVYLNLLYEKDNYALSFKPWYRLPEEDKPFPGSPEGDDNPDISDYMGHFELGGAYQYEEYEFHMLTRQNFATGNGALELGWTFPVWGRLRGYLQYFNGYGESMIDYDHNQQRLGIGLALTDLL